MGVPTLQERLSTIPKFPVPSVNKSKLPNKPDQIKKLNIGTWNIKRGLIKRELEISQLLKEEKLNVLYITETDIHLTNPEDFKIEGYKTFTQMRESNKEKIRLMAIVKDDDISEIKLKEDLMSTKFPSIWLEIKISNQVPLITCGVYREWSHKEVLINFTKKTAQCHNLASFFIQK